MEELIVKDTIDEYLSVSKYINWDESRHTLSGDRIRHFSLCVVEFI